MASCAVGFTSGAWGAFAFWQGKMQAMADPEQPELTLGIIPLVDCATIMLAETLGGFERHGLEVDIRRPTGGHGEPFSALARPRPAIVKPFPLSASGEQR